MLNDEKRVMLWQVEGAEPASHSSAQQCLPRVDVAMLSKKTCIHDRVVWNHAVQKMFHQHKFRNSKKPEKRLIIRFQMNTGTDSAAICYVQRKPWLIGGQT